VIAHVSGTLLSKDLDRVEVMTSGGVAYELAIPLGVYESLPRAGETVSLHTHLVVKEDGWLLFGFANAFEKRVFQRVLNAPNVDPKVKDPGNWPAELSCRPPRCIWRSFFYGASTTGGFRSTASSPSIHAR